MENTYFSTKKNFVNSYVGGNEFNDNNTNYLNSQNTILNRQEQKKIGSLKANKLLISKSIQQNNQIIDENNNEINDEYDPYMHFLEKRNLKENNTKKKNITTYLHIDSQARVKTPFLTTSDTINLTNNPIYFDQTINSPPYLMWIYHPNNGFSKGDRITISGIITSSVVLKTQYSYKTNNDTISVINVIFTQGSKYVKFICSPNLLSIDNISPSFINNYILLNSFYVNISGFTGSTSPTFIGNIPINYLNSIQKIYLQQELNENNDLTYFYIQLPTTYLGSTELASYNIQLSFLHVGGIPLNLLNAEYPIDTNNLNGYAEVYSVKSTDYFSVIIPYQALYNEKFGGSNVYISTITNVMTGYTNPNFYSIDLKKTYHNVVSARLLNTIFPNTSKIFRSTTTITNTKLYWQNQTDGETVYSIQIPDGNYDPTSLKTVIETYMNNVPRKIISSNTFNNSYENVNYIQVNINTDTNIVTFKSYSQALLSNPISSVTPEINLSATSIASTDTYTITIYQVNHNIKEGDQILISGMIDHSGIPATALNSTQIVTKVTDVDHYEFVITHINLNSYRVITNGGFAVVVYVPTNFRLRFDYPDTMGEQLGFRYVGSPLAITNYSTVITNQDSYFNEPNTDPSGNLITITNNSLKISGYDYIVMTCEQFSDLTNINNISSNINHIGLTSIPLVFAKINLSCAPGKIVYDSFVNTPLYFYNSLEISKLTFTFYSSDGNLYDFAGLDHSFLIELVTVDESVNHTNIVSKSGRES
jgi:hypothetical protein